jgi:hypothetical protein
MAPVTPKEILILTIGHSTRPIEEFAGLILAHDVQRLVDVRTVLHELTSLARIEGQRITYPGEGEGI